MEKVAPRAHSTCESVSPWSHRCARDSGGRFTCTVGGGSSSNRLPLSQGSAWQSWPNKGESWGWTTAKGPSTPNREH